MQPFPAARPPAITRDLGAIGPQYGVNPWQTMAGISQAPTAWYNSGALMRFDAPEVRLPWNPWSYPSVGREPGMFLPPDIPAVPAVPGQAGRISFRKRSLGRTVSSGTPAASSPGQQQG